MTEEELEQLNEDSKNDRHIIVGSDIRRLVAEVKKLRLVIKGAEDSGDAPSGFSACPWCCAETPVDPMTHFALDATGKRKHYDDCWAFTVDGVVR